MKKPSSGLQDATAVFTSQVIAVLLGLATQSVLGWCLGPEGRGEYGVFLAMFAIGAVVFTLGTDRGIQCHLVAQRFGLAESISLMLCFVLAGTLAAALAGAIAIGIGVPGLAGASTACLVLGLLLLPALALRVAMQLIVQGQRHFRVEAIVTIGGAAAQLVLAAVFLLLFRWGVAGALGAYAGGSAVAVVASFLFLRYRYGHLLTRPQWTAVSTALGYAFRYLPARLGNVLSFHAVTLELAFLVTMHQVGLYALAATLLERLMMASTAMNQVLQPRMGGDERHRRSLAAQCCRLSVLPVTGLVLAAVAASSFAIPLLFSRSFQGSVWLFWLMAAGIWVRGISSPLLPYFLAANRPGILSAATAARLGVTVTSLPLLVIGWGISGAAVAATLGYVTGATVLIVSFVRVTGYPVRSLLVCTPDDLRWLRDSVHRALGKTPRSRHVRVPTPMAHRSGRPLHRQLVVTPDHVFKYQDADAARAELVKSTLAFELGRRTGLFSVPRVIRSELDDGLIVFERMVDLVPLWDQLTQAKSAGEWTMRAARSLAAIHNQLSLPAEIHASLATPWHSDTASQTVAIHGDFNAHNLCVQQPSGDLVILDWATTDRAGGRATHGPWCFDAAWFVAALFTREWGGWKRVHRAPELADLFLDTYANHRAGGIRLNEFRPYFQQVLDLIAAAYRRTAVRGTDRLWHWTCGQLAMENVARFLSQHPQAVDTPRRAPVHFSDFARPATVGVGVSEER